MNNATSMKEFTRNLISLETEKRLLEEQRDKAEKALLSTKDELKITDEALTILRLATEQTQKALQFRISNLVTLALQTIFPEEYTFELAFETKRGQIEIDLFLIDPTGFRMSPIEASGGGIVNVVEFALRLSLWSLMPSKSRPVFVLDEPFHYVSKDLQPKVSELLSTLSDKLKVQFIIVSHQRQVVEEADKVFLVTQSLGKSTVEEVQSD